MGRCVEKRDCEKCGGTDTLQVFADSDGNLDGFCFKCSSFFDTIDGKKKISQEELEQLDAKVEDKLAEIESLRQTSPLGGCTTKP